MPPELETRVSQLEHSHTALTTTLGQINRTLEKIEVHIDELFEGKSKLDSIDTAWKRIDHLAHKSTELDNQLNKLLQSCTIMENTMQLKLVKLEALDREFAILQSEHKSCNPKVEKHETCMFGVEHRLKTLEDRVAAAGSFVQGRVASVTDKILYAMLSVAAIATVFMVLKK